ncbi:MAG: hypothetical protein JNJ83_16840 [Verrucomicrobiaceae bacterium]|nr:hypothetical protein [Verrucomicrobiaceae bacterium]
MKTPQATLGTRRAFLAEVGRTTIAATIGPALAAELGISTSALAEAPTKRLSLGSFESLAEVLEQTPVEVLQPLLVAKLKSGVSLKQLTAAAALVNARRFGGEDYIGFHTFMALSPALRMSSLMPAGQEALPVLKVLYRNTARLHDSGRTDDSLTPLQADAESGAVRELIVKKKRAAAESALERALREDKHEALASLLTSVCDNPEVHRTALPYRAWDMAELVGAEHALTLLRQSVHYCFDAERARTAEWDKHAQMLARMLDAHKLHHFSPGTKTASDELVKELASTFATKSPDEAAEAAASTLADGVDPRAIGEAMSLAASRLVLCDPGRQPQWEGPGKPAGSVHGDSTGVHASDAANAWRNLAHAGDGRHTATCLVMGAWIIARDRGTGPLLPQLPTKRLVDGVRGKSGEELGKELAEAIRDNQQAHAAAVVERMGQLGISDKLVFRRLLRFAVSEDGALHAEKYFHTVWDDFQITRPSMRWQHLTALARVTASEFGRPAPGQEEARELLGV